MISIFEATAVKTYPVVVFVDGQGTADQAGSKDRCVKSDELPHSRVMVGEDLQLGVEVQIQVDKSSEGSRGVTRGHGLETVVDLLPVTCADAAVEHDLAVAVGNVAIDAKLVTVVCFTETKAIRDDWLADSEEVRSQTTNEPLDEHLENGSSDERVQKTDRRVVDVPEAAGADLDDQEDEEWNEEGHECGGVDGDDLGKSVRCFECEIPGTYLIAEWIRELRVNNLSVAEDDGE